MAVPSGAHTLGPENATLSVRTLKGGAAAIAGHNLRIEVGSWEARLEIGDSPAQDMITLTADAGSLRVVEGTGGIQQLGDDDIAAIKQTIDEEVLKREPISFRSTAVRRSADGGTLDVQGELELIGNSAPVTFELKLDPDGRLTGTATVRQSDWGIKPYSALFGTLKVADEVVVAIEGNLRSASQSL